MNKKIKVIDLIDKKYHNLELPKHIRINKLEYFYNENRKTYDSEYGEQMSFDFTDNVLNMEVEILEDNTEEIEKYKGESFEQLGYDIGKLSIAITKGFEKAIKEMGKDLKNE